MHQASNAAEARANRYQQQDGVNPPGRHTAVSAASDPDQGDVENRKR